MNLLSPKIAYADFNEFLGKVNAEIINPLILFLFALAVLFFLYGMLEFLFNQQSEEKRTAGKSHMLWGVLGIAIMLGVFTIMNIILNTLSIPKSEIDVEEGTVELGG